MSTTTDTQGIRISGYGGPQQTVTLSGVSTKDRQHIEGAMHGVKWMRVCEGKLVVHEIYRPFPDPIEDVDMHPFWSKTEQKGLLPDGNLAYTANKFSDPKSSRATICVSHICGYGYTPERYKVNARKLESFGFIQMRSPRRNDSTFYEHWRLHEWDAQGALKEHLSKPSEKMKKGNEYVDSVKDFLSRHGIYFGTMDASITRWGLNSPD